MSVQWLGIGGRQQYSCASKPSSGGAAVTEIVQPADPGNAAEHAEPDDALETNLAIVDGVLVVGQVVGDTGGLIGEMVAGVGEVLGTVGDALSALDVLGN